MQIAHPLQTAAILGGLLLAPALASATEANFDRTLNVAGNVIVSVSTGSGYVHISPGSDNQLHIVGHVKSGNGGWFHSGNSDEHVKQVAANPPIEQNGNNVRIGKQHGDWLQNISIDYEITTPRATSLSVDSGSGDLRIADIIGGLKAETGSGSIEVHGISGAVDLNTGSGDIRAELVNPSTTRAETGSGSIDLNGVKGALKANTGSGSISIQGEPTSEWKLETGSGGVTLTTGSARFSLDAQTGSGSIHSAPPISTHGSIERDHLKGDINGGGALVRVETGSGDIQVK